MYKRLNKNPNTVSLRLLFHVWWVFFCLFYFVVVFFFCLIVFKKYFMFRCVMKGQKIEKPGDI